MIITSSHMEHSGSDRKPTTPPWRRRNGGKGRLESERYLPEEMEGSLEEIPGRGPRTPASAGANGGPKPEETPEATQLSSQG